MSLRHLDLFSGIGGFALGLESTGHFKTVAFCEIEDYPRRVLSKHWPDVPCYEDVRNVGAERLASDGIGLVDIVTGGFPCQDVSIAGARTGLSGERSGLWSELFRVITEVRPRWTVIENVPGLRTLGADAVLADLAGAGYAAWPLVVGAVHARAPHRRQRVWIVAHAKGEQRDGGAVTGQRGDKGRPEKERQSNGQPPGGRYRLAADAERQRLQGCSRERLSGTGRPSIELTSGREQWSWDRAPEPVLRGVHDGLHCGLDRRERLKALGNAVVPQIVAAIGRAIAHV